LRQEDVNFTFLSQGDTLSQVLINLALEKMIRAIQEEEAMELFSLTHYWHMQMTWSF